MRQSETIIRSLKAHNSSQYTGNPLHDPIKARQMGYQGALVAGIDTCGYLSYPPVKLWGRKWLERGTMQCVLIKPLFDDDPCDLVVDQSSNDIVELRVQDDVRATGRYALDYREVRPELDEIDFVAPFPERRPIENYLAIGTTFPTIECALTADESDSILKEAGEPLPIYEEQGLMHPGQLIRLCIQAVARNFVTESLVHLESRLQNFSTIAATAPVQARARVAASYETRGHNALMLQVNVIANGACAARIQNSVIYKTRRRTLPAKTEPASASTYRPKAGTTAMFKAIHLSQDENKGTLACVKELSQSQLPNEAVKIQVEYSSLNYKDALAISGAAPVVRRWPMIPGIDLAGVVEESDDPRYKVGDRVIVNGWGVGETRWGGLSQKAVMPGDFLTRLPESFSTGQAMAIGTAGYTAALCLLAIEGSGGKPSAGEILVTGANGGVGSFAISLLARKGYKVAASTGRLEESQRLLDLGATTIVDRRDFSKPGKALQSERWAGAIDCVGGHTLANVCASARYGSTIVACGNAGGMDFPATVAPFILRGVRLIGIDSVNAAPSLRDAAWKELSTLLKASTLSDMVEEISLADAIRVASMLLEGRIAGRLVVNPNL